MGERSRDVGILDGSEISVSPEDVGDGGVVESEESRDERREEGGSGAHLGEK